MILKSVASECRQCSFPPYTLKIFAKFDLTAITGCVTPWVSENRRLRDGQLINSMSTNWIVYAHLYFLSVPFARSHLIGKLL